MSTKRTIWTILIAICGVGVLIYHTQLYLPFIADDALISLRYSQRLLEGDGLTWTAGHPVEGYSNLLWVLCIAALGYMGIDLVDATRLFGIACMSGVVIMLCVWYVRTRRNTFYVSPLILGILFFCTTGATAVWAIGGLEQPLYAVLLALTLPACFVIMEADRPQLPPILWATCGLGLMTITRLDGPLFTIALFVACLLFRWLTKRPIPWWLPISIVVIPLMFYGGQMLFRWLYYGELVPNTALVKVSPSAKHFRQGYKYVRTGLKILSPFSMLATVSLVVQLRHHAHRARATLLLTMLLMWFAYLIFIGGDIFPAIRHFIPVIVIFAYALIDGGHLAMTALDQHIRLRPLIIMLIFATLCIPYMQLQLLHGKNRDAVFERWEWECESASLPLKQAFGERQPLIAVSAAGCWPYWTEFPALDMYGLNDYYLPRFSESAKNKGNQAIGHELADCDYVLDQNPDIITYHSGTTKPRPCDMNSYPRYQMQYEHVQLLGAPPLEYPAHIYVNKYSEKIGIEQVENGLIVPSYFINGNKKSYVYYEEDVQALVMDVTADRPAHISLDHSFLQVIDPQSVVIDVDSVESAAILNTESTYAIDGSFVVTLTTTEAVTVSVKSLTLTAP